MSQNNENKYGAGNRRRLERMRTQVRDLQHFFEPLNTMPRSAAGYAWLGQEKQGKNEEQNMGGHQSTGRLSKIAGLELGRNFVLRE